jgi:hypothetical protein
LRGQVAYERLCATCQPFKEARDYKTEASRHLRHVLLSISTIVLIT